MGARTAHNQGPAFRERLAGQVIGLFLWPMLTVVLVAGALYADRVGNLHELTIQKEALLVKAVRMLLDAERQAAATDLQLLLDDDSFVRAATEQTPDDRAYVSRLLADMLNRNPGYEQVVLFDGHGAEIARAGFREKKNDWISGEKGEKTSERRAFIETVLNSSPGTLHTFPSALTLFRGGPAAQTDPLLHLGLRIASVDGRSPMSVIIDYRLANFVELVRGIGSGDQGVVMIAGSFGELETIMAASPPSPRSSAIYRLSQSLSRDHLFEAGNLYSSDWYSLPSRAASFDDGDVSGNRVIASQESERRVIVAELPASFFVEQKHNYLLLLSILVIALLVPSFVVCLFWGKARIKAQEEARLRAIEQVEHLDGLEQQVRERTRELDDRNLQLNVEIAERLNAEFKLRQSNELLSGMIESIDGIIYVADIQTHEILFANRGLKQLFGFDPVGKKCWQFIHGSQDGPCSFCVNHLLLKENGLPTEPYEWEYQNPFNKKWYRAKDQAIRWSNGKYVKLEIAIDISEQKRLQRFLQEAQKQAEIARKMRSRFVALVAHDLKSPFYSITQMLKRILERETFTNEIHRQFLENIVINGYRMLQMIDDLLSMGRFEAAETKLERTFFSVAEMADEVILNFKLPASEKSLTVVNRLPADCCVFADKYLYFVVLNNLLSNAIKFSETGGRIELFQPDPNEPMTVAVRDEGLGMSQDYVDNLFKVDVKTSCTGTKGESGSGLGLLFCQDILKAHDGKLTVDSQEGVGTTFAIVLPACCVWELPGQSNTKTKKDAACGQRHHAPLDQ